MQQIAANAVSVSRLTDHFVIKLGVVDQRGYSDFDPHTTVVMPLSIAARMALSIFKEVSTSGADITQFYAELSAAITKLNEKPKQE